MWRNHEMSFRKWWVFYYKEDLNTSLAEWYKNEEFDTNWSRNKPIFWIYIWTYIPPVSWETCIQVKKQKLEPDMEQQTGSKLGKVYIRAVYCHSAYLTYMHSASCEIPSWIKLKLESRLLREISITSDMQIIPPHGRKWRGTKEPLEEVERGERKSWLETQHSIN